MKTLNIFLLLSVFLLQACSLGGFHLTKKRYDATSATKVEYYVGVPNKRYIEIGSVWGDDPYSIDGALERIRQEAAARGADAIIKMRTYNMNTNARAGLTGMAVKYQ